MKNIILLFVVFLFMLSPLSACEGDCVLCHPKLVKEDGKLDKEHAILTTCKTCHTQEEMEKIDMGGGCGQDCWECHDIKKVTQSHIPQHQGLQKCIDCHLTLDKNLFGGGSVEPFSSTPTLDELINTPKASSEQAVKILEKVVVEFNETTPKKEKMPKEEKERTFVEKVLEFFESLWHKIMAIFS